SPRWTEYEIDCFAALSGGASAMVHVAPTPETPVASAALGASMSVALLGNVSLTSATIGNGRVIVCFTCSPLKPSQDTVVVALLTFAISYVTCNVPLLYFFLRRCLVGSRSDAVVGLPSSSYDGFTVRGNGVARSERTFCVVVPPGVRLKSATDCETGG